jgi:hypothetical protein
VLQLGDRLVVLASLAALRQVEAGNLKKRCWSLELRSLRPNAPIFEVQMALARYLGSVPGDMAKYVDFEQGARRTEPLYQVPGRLLEQALKRLGVDCELVIATTCEA